MTVSNKTFVIVSAVVRNGDDFLIAKRADTKRSAPGQWEFISGFVDKLESAEEIILEELKEELSVEGEIIKRGAPFLFIDDEGRWVVIPFLIVAPTKEIKINPHDHSEAKWIKANEIQKQDHLQAFLESKEVRGYLGLK